MENYESWSLIVQHLSKSSTSDEEQALAKWAAEDSENQRILDEARRVWSLTGKFHSLPNIDVSEEWLAFVRRIETAEQYPSKNRGDLMQRLGTPLKIAALFIFAAVAYWLFRPKENYVRPALQNIPIAKLSVVTSADSVRKYYLPDSSLVWLNIHTEIKFDSLFINRIVYLKGEGFFQVRAVKDSNLFSIHSQGARISVVGTEFNVIAQEGRPVEVIVVSGKVELCPADTMQSEKVMLGPNDKGTFDAKDSSLLMTKNTDPAFLEWRKKGNPVYYNEKNQPNKFLKHSYTFKKNVIHQTQINGRITNLASFASYKKIKLKISSVNSKGKKSNVYLDISSNTPLLPGKSIEYHHTLFDVLSTKTSVIVTIESVSGL